MKKLEISSWIRDWFYLDSRRACPEGTKAEWITIINDIEKGEKSCCAGNRLAYTDDVICYLFYSPRNSEDSYDGVSINKLEIEESIKQWKEILGS